MTISQGLIVRRKGENRALHQTYEAELEHPLAQSRFRRVLLSTLPRSQTDDHGFPLPRNCIVILELDTAAAVSLVTHFPTVRLVPFCHTGPVSLCNSLTSSIDPDSGPVGGVAVAVHAMLPHLVDRHLLFALLLGRRRSSAMAFARSMGIATRTLQHTTHEAHLPRPHRLLLWGQAFWTLWRLQRWAMTSKQAAAAGGFQNSSSMTSALRPVLGTIPHQATVRASEPHITERFVAELTGQLGEVVAWRLVHRNTLVS